MPTIQDFRKKHHALKVEAAALCDKAMKEGRDLDQQENARYTALVGELQDTSSMIDKFLAGGPDVLPFRTNSTAFRVGQELQAALAVATPEERGQFEELSGFLRGNIKSLANLTPSSDGGVLIPSFVQAAIERNYSQFDSVRSVSRRWGTPTGADTVFPVLSDSESGEQISSAATTGADATVSGDTPPTTLTGPTLKAYKTSSKPVFIPRETQDDSVVDIVGEVIGALLARVIRFENARFTSGSGSSQAAGFLHDATPFEESGGILTLDGALDLAYSVPALYRPNGVYMCSDATAKYLRKIKTGISGDKTQLWGDANYTLGTPATMHGYRVIINNDMSDVSTDGTYSGKTVLAFGDFSKFVIREVEDNGTFLYRYPVPAKDGTGVIMFRRTDSKLIVPTAISKLTVGGS